MDDAVSTLDNTWYFVSSTRQPLYYLGTCLGRLEYAIEACEEILKHAKANCARNHVDLMNGTRRLLEAKLSASKIQTRLLETRSVTTWEEFRGISGRLGGNYAGHQSLTIEAERQRQLSEGLKEVREIHETVIGSPAATRPTTCTATRRLESATRNTSYELSL
ncbi:hypothetical protein B0H14DRAFT_2629165 [Mycena olivaceomarginata]|nr:hypothetical protein B0H14DRAFT_2629165 [Mycena olivaceomarginata]